MLHHCKGTIISLYIVTSSCIPISRHDHVLTWLQGIMLQKTSALTLCDHIEDQLCNDESVFIYREKTEGKDVVRRCAFI
jgi:hypothetical protein